MPLRTKVAAIATLWIGIGLSAVAVLTGVAGRIVLGVIAVAVTAHIVLIPTRRSKPQSM